MASIALISQMKPQVSALSVLTASLTSASLIDSLPRLDDTIRGRGHLPRKMKPSSAHYTLEVAVGFCKWSGDNVEGLAVTYGQSRAESQSSAAG